jgi:hypothetical protein
MSREVLGSAVWMLSIVLVWSGFAKLRHLRLVALAIVDFGVSKRPHVSIAVGVAVTELALAIALISGVRQQVTLAVATLLFLVFGSLLAISLRAGRRFPCRCFGGEDTSISFGTLLRSVGLALLAAGLWVQSILDPGQLRPLQGEVDLQVLVGVAAVAIAAVCSRLPDLFRWNRDTVEHFRAARTVEQAQVTQRQVSEV